MNCLNPIKIDTDEIEIYGTGKIFIPCGKCEVCRNSDSLSWRVRLLEEFYNSDNTMFVTLTYNDNVLPFELCYCDNKPIGFYPCVSKSDVQKFFKRFRFHYESYYKDKDIKMSYFLVSEYGPTTFRPHYHLIIFNFPVLSSIPEVNISKASQTIYDIWGKGFITCDLCNENRVAYCTKYMSCQSVIPDYLPKPFRLMSKGLGKSYLNNSNRIKWHKDGLNNFYPVGNLKYRLPRYYKDKIFCDDEKLMIYQLHVDNQEKKFINYHQDLSLHRKEVKNDIEAKKQFKRKYLSKTIKKRKDI